MDTSNCARAKICILQFASSKVGATFDFNTHSLIKILLFATIPCATMCDLMSLRPQVVAYVIIFEIWMDFGLPFN